MALVRAKVGIFAYEATSLPFFLGVPARLCVAPSSPGRHILLSERGIFHGYYVLLLREAVVTDAYSYINQNMYAIIINAVAVVVGSAIGALFRRGISEKYINVLNTAMGLCASVPAQTVAIDEEPLDSSIWLTRRTVYGKSLGI